MIKSQKNQRKYNELRKNPKGKNHSEREKG